MSNRLAYIAVGSGVVVGIALAAGYYICKHRNKCKKPEESTERETDRLLSTSDPEGGLSSDEESPSSPVGMGPNTLKYYGYHFHKGKLRKIDDKNSGFTFENQQHYETIGSLVEEEVYKMLETECNLTRHRVPISGTSLATFIFLSEDWRENEHMLILIHGSGVVRAGQWTRKLIINDCVESGTQIPYIKRARQMGYSVMVLNTNDNRRFGHPIPGSSTPEQHARYVWDNFILSDSCKVKHIAIVAHSYGGVVTTNLLERARDFQNRVFAIGFTDSVHSRLLPGSKQAFFRKVAKNWVTSSLEVGTELSDPRNKDCPLASAGTTDHIWTSHRAIDKVFEFIEEKDPARTDTDVSQAAVADAVATPDKDTSQQQPTAAERPKSDSLITSEEKKQPSEKKQEPSEKNQEPNEVRQEPSEVRQEPSEVRQEPKEEKQEPMEEVKELQTEMSEKHSEQPVDSLTNESSPEAAEAPPNVSSTSSDQREAEAAGDKRLAVDVTGDESREDEKGAGVVNKKPRK